MKRITVGLRIKPEKTKDDLIALKDNKVIEITLSGQKYEYTFDDIFDEYSTNDNIFNISCKQLVENVIEGYNGCIFAYGQTGAGKTHTMSGPEDNGERGLCLRVAGHLFENSRKITISSGDSFSIRMSALEIYNEAIIDILRETTQQQGTIATTTIQPKLSIMETSNGVIVPTLFLLPLVSEEDAYTALMDAYVNRISASHNLNKRSSRSHAIYTFYITRSKVINNKEPDVVQSKLHLVDLAGSERVEKSGSIQGIQKEANYINRSLSYLEQVVIALTQKDRDHIPYRQSKLTHLLKDSLGGNCNTYMIACVWPHRHHAWETLSTLRFSQRMKAIVNTPIRNKLVAQDVTSIKSQQQIDSLKKELALRDMIASRETWLPTLTKAQQFNTIQQTCNFVESIAKTSNNNDNDLDNYMEFQSLSQIRLTADTLKAIIWEACDHNQSKVTVIIEQFLRVQNMTRDHSNDRPDISNQSYVDADDNNIVFDAKSDNNNDTIYDNNNVTYDNNNNVTSPSKIPQQSPSQPMLTFEEFKETRNGKILHESYVQACDELHSLKHRQKEIIGMINKLKSTIDTLSRELSIYDNDDNDDNNNDNDNDNNKDSITITLEHTKSDYRIAYSELQLCKQQVNEMQSLKKRAMATLVQNFEKYQETVITGTIRDLNIDKI